MFRGWKALLQKRLAVKLSWRYSSGIAVERALTYKVGQKIHGFTVNQVTPVPDLFLAAVKLTHDGTRAQYLHVAREDSNNLFSVQFRTTPMDNTGVPHILEHTVLCGSEKYPCRDPFFKMLNRSLSTFMNAFTASDFTMYPFSTQNGKDFQNLLSVYLDAAFFPCLRELDFWQEGWRLENENPTDPKSPLAFKGVVFNEMKGAFADNERLFAQYVQNMLHPEHTYSVVSGGKPLHIVDLSWEQLKKFHATYYHPSNARFFTYGDLPLEQHLKQIHEEALSRLSAADTDTAVPSQPRWGEPREHHVTCGPDPLAPDPSKQNTVCISYLLGDISDTFEIFTLNLLSSLLVSGPNSPFYKTLIEANIGTDFTSVSGFDGSTKDVSFSVGLQGVAKKDIETVKCIIPQTIDDIIVNGFEKERIEALLHKIEIQMKHQTANFGLALASYIASCWNHDGDPIETLKISEKVSRFRQCLKENPKFLQEKVKLYFKDNPHRLTLSMSPDESYFENQAKMEAAKLQGKITALTENDKKEIFDKGLQLIAAQNTPHDASSLPALKVFDIQPKITFTEVEIGNAGEAPVQYCAQPTNGMVYFRAMCSLNSLPEDLKVYVPLFCNVITKLGCGILDYRQQAQQIELKTGGMSASQQVIPDCNSLDIYEQSIMLDSMCLERNLPDMMQLWSDIFNAPHFDDEERLRVLVMMAAQELSSGIADSGHMYAMIRAGRTLTASGDLKEIFNGMHQVKEMKRIAEMTDLTLILRMLPRIKRYIFSQENIRCAVNATPSKLSDASREVEKFINGIARKKKDRKGSRPNIIEKPLNPLNEKTFIPGTGISRKLISDPSFKPCQMKTYFRLPFPVNYVSECIRTVPYTDKDFASLTVLARLMTAKFLHVEIREKGGAYGGGAKMGHGGLFAFYSYRDPNCLETLSTFRNGSEWAKAGQFKEQDIDEAKLSVFSAVDAPVAPSDKGMNLFMCGISDELKQQFREQLFAVDKSSIVDVANKYLGFGQRTAAVAILGPANDKVNSDPSWVVR
ncbi:presequence protease, mitochondrial [Polypterus senegalus]|nr:presequence protease, mitochondrial [Polypterus senegalus]